MSLTLVGVFHDDKREDFPKALDYVSRIPLDSIVSLECGTTASELLNFKDEDLDKYTSGARFFNKIARRLDERSIIINTVEDIELNYYQDLCIDQDEKPITELTECFLYLNLLRSIQMYRQIMINRSTHAILGAQHVYDIAAMETGANIHYISFDPGLIIPTEGVIEYLKGKKVLEALLTGEFMSYFKEEAKKLLKNKLTAR